MFLFFEFLKISLNYLKFFLSIFALNHGKEFFLKSTSRNKKMNKDTLMNIKIQSESGGLIEGQ